MQKQNLNCDDARYFVHLSVGDDNLPEEETRLAEHLHSCSPCRAYHAGMVDTMRVIDRVRDEERATSASGSRSGSLWPAMAEQLKVRQANALAPQEGRRFNVAVAALCVCSLMLALVTAVQNLPSNTNQMADNYYPMPEMNSMNVGFSNSGNVNLPEISSERLIEVSGPQGSRLLLDRATGQYYVPNFATSGDQNMNF